MKFWIDPDGQEIAAPNGHIALAVSLLPVKVIAPLQRAYEGEEFNEQVYEAMFHRGYLHARITGQTVFLQQQNVDAKTGLPMAQLNWIEAKRMHGFEVQFNGRQSTHMNKVQPIIVILEDNLDRVKIMHDVVAKLPGNFELRHFDNVEALRATDLRDVRLISLDFSLDSSSVKMPGTGMDAVQFLIQRRDPVCPVIVHTMSTADSRRMVAALGERGWTAKPVNFGTRDRAEQWRVAAMALMRLATPKA